MVTETASTPHPHNEKQQKSTEELSNEDKERESYATEHSFHTLTPSEVQQEEKNPIRYDEKHEQRRKAEDKEALAVARQNLLFNSLKVIAGTHGNVGESMSLKNEMPDIQAVIDEYPPDKGTQYSSTIVMTPEELLKNNHTNGGINIKGPLTERQVKSLVKGEPVKKILKEEKPILKNPIRTVKKILNKVLS